MDSQVQFFDGTNFVPAYICHPFHLDPYSYDTIPGTHWVSVDPLLAGAQFSFFTYRITFVLPASYADPSLAIQIHCDNCATIFLNGNQIGAQTDLEIASNFQDPPETFATTNAAFFHPGTNVLTFTVRNYCNETGLDFAADICYSAGCVDQNPPAVTCNVELKSLWPANHNLVEVGLTASATDDCDHPGDGDDDDAESQIPVQVTVFSDEPDLDILGSGNFSPDAKNIAPITLRLRAERSGNEDGRVYLIVVTATDNTGKTGFCAQTVTVPHDQSKASKDAVAANAAETRAYFLANHMPPAGYVQVGIGPVVGPKQ